MRKLFFALFAPLVLASCAPMLAALGGVAASPAAVADKTTVDERGGLAVETLYAAAAQAGALAFRAGVVQPSADAAVQRDEFCQLVAARLYDPTDRGGQLMAVECKLRAARDAARRAYDAGNSSGYALALTEASGYARELLALIRGD